MSAMLTLEVIAPDPASLGAAASHAFGPEGGTIGRSHSSYWTLPDGRVSNRHAVISCEHGAYFIRDTSTNGVYLNESEVRLVQGRPEPLSHGDRIVIGPYQIRVVLGLASAARLPGQANAFVLDETDPFAVIDDFSPARRDNPSSPLGNDSQIVDPLELLGGSSAPVPRPRAPNPNDPMYGGSPIEDHYRPPLPAPPAPGPIIPPDYDPLRPDSGQFSTTVPPPPHRPAYETGHAAPPPRPSSKDSQTLSRSRSDRLRGADRFAPRPDVTGARDAAPADATPSLANDATPPPRPRLTRQPSSSGAAAGTTPPGPLRSPSPPPVPSTVNALAEVLAGAGLANAPVTDELGHDLGRILAVVVGGVIDVLRARQQIKDEFRMRVTQFRPVDNNPLKFSANVEHALRILLVDRNAAYLGPVEAFEDAFDDLRGHQLAMLAGMRVAFEALLRQFDAARLQEQFDRQLKKGALLAVPAKLRYWEMYREHVAALAADADGTFRRLFVEEFARAYEEQLEVLKAERRHASRQG